MQPVVNWQSEDQNKAAWYHIVLLIIFNFLLKNVNTSLTSWQLMNTQQMSLMNWQCAFASWAPQIDLTAKLDNLNKKWLQSRLQSIFLSKEALENTGSFDRNIPFSLREILCLGEK